MSLADKLKACGVAADKADELKEFSEKKLYFQLVQAALPIVKGLSDGKLALELLESEIKPIATKLNPVSYMEFVDLVLKKSFPTGASAADAKTAFLDTNFEPFKLPEDQENDKDGDVAMGIGGNNRSSGNNKFGNKGHFSKSSKIEFQDAKALFLVLKCEILVEAGQLEKAKDVMDDLEEDLLKGKRPIVQIGPQVFSWFYRAQLKLYAATADASKYYASGVNFLLYTPLEKAEEDFVLSDLAVALGVAALTAPGEYNFGELLELSIWNEPAPKGGKDTWMYDLLFAFREGQYDLYNTAMQKHSAKFNGVESLKANKDMVYEKFCGSVLMEFAFRQTNKKHLSLDDMRKEVQLKDVESLLINAMCANLLKGTIDEVQGTFCCTWVKPRVLDTGRLEVLRNRVSGWIEKQQNVLTKLEEMQQELLVS